MLEWGNTLSMAVLLLHCHCRVHDFVSVTGALTTAMKEEPQQYIKDQLELGEEGLGQRDHYLLEINFGDSNLLTDMIREQVVVSMASTRRQGDGQGSFKY